jgi:hypothetical protein
VLPSLVMVCNPTVQYVLFEWLLARIREARTKAGRKGSAIAPTGFQVGVYGSTCQSAPVPRWKSAMLDQVTLTSAGVAGQPASGGPCCWSTYALKRRPALAVW